MKCITSPGTLKIYFWGCKLKLNLSKRFVFTEKMKRFFKISVRKCKVPKEQRLKWHIRKLLWMKQLLSSKILIGPKKSYLGKSIPFTRSINKLMIVFQSKDQTGLDMNLLSRPRSFLWTLRKTQRHQTWHHGHKFLKLTAKMSLTCKNSKLKSSL